MLDQFLAHHRVLSAVNKAYLFYTTVAVSSLPASEEEPLGFGNDKLDVKVPLDCWMKLLSAFCNVPTACSVSTSTCARRYERGLPDSSVRTGCLYSSSEKVDTSLLAPAPGVK